MINLVKYVPYQVCPLCAGRDSKCSVCKGEKIIPMHVIESTTKKETVEIVPPPKRI